MEKAGYIYVLTNESFHKDNWIKIGYADDVDRRVKELSNTSVPLPYKVYCTYEIPRISGTKDPDKLLHDLIAKLNPGLRITPNREFFEMLPWDAYDMLFAIAQMHGRTDKLKRYDDNSAGVDVDNESAYSIETLFPLNSPIRSTYDKMKNLILSEDPSLEITPLQLYVAFKKGKNNVICLWPKAGWIEVVLNAKTGQIKDTSDTVYDISNRKWTAAQYAFRLYDNMDEALVKDIIRQAIALKK